MKNYTGKVFNPTTRTLTPWTRELASFEPPAEEAAHLVQPETFEDCWNVFDSYDYSALLSCEAAWEEGRFEELPALIEHATALLIQHHDDPDLEEGFLAHWLQYGPPMPDTLQTFDDCQAVFIRYAPANWAFLNHIWYSKSDADERIARALPDLIEEATALLNQYREAAALPA